MATQLGRRSVLAAIVAAAAAHLGAPGAPAASFTVTTGVDAVDASPGDGTCANAGDACALRAAVQEANALPGTDTIVLGPRVHTLSIPGAGENLAATGDLDVRQRLVVRGAGRNTTIVDGNDLDRVFELHNVDVGMSRLTIRDGRGLADGAGIAQHRGRLELRSAAIRSNGQLMAGPNGGGIFASGDLVVIATIVAGNRASDGGGIDLDEAGNSDPSLTLRSSRLTANRAEEDGGGLEVEEGRAVISLSTVARNRAMSADGGGIENDRSNLIVRSTTISGNRAGDNGGGIANDQGTVSLDNSTISGNSASNKGGGIDNRFASRLLVRRSTVVGNRAGLTAGGIANRRRAGRTDGLARLHGAIVAGNIPRDCGGGVALVSLGRNLSSDATCSLTLASDLPSTAAGLGPLADNGGPTRTHLPAVGSPAVDAGLAARPAVDQRGVTRPQGTASDIGAVERAAADLR